MLSKPVNVPVPPTLTLQVENPCEDQPAVFTLVDAAGDPVNNWQWNIGGTLVSGNPATAVVSLAASTPVSVITTHASGCSYTQFYPTTIHPTPIADFLALPDRGDAPLTVQFQNLSSGATQYRWLFNDKIPVSSTATSPVYTFLELGDYSAQLVATNSFGCSDSTAMPIQVLIPEIDLEVTSFSLSPDPATGKLRPSLTLLNKSNIPVVSVEVFLLLSDRATVSETLVVNLSPGASVTKALSAVVDPGQFVDPFVCVEVVSEKDLSPGNNKSCINFSDEDYIFDPYPNPSTDQVQVDWISDQAGAASVTIANSQGRTEYYWETPSQPGLNRSVHDLSFLAAGVYFVTVRTSTSVQTRRIVRL
jgi:PKD repeat protein